MSQPEPSIEDAFAQLGDLFGQFFGGTSHHLGVTLELTDAEAADGCVKDVEIQRRSPCGACDGRGTASPASTSTPCAKCGGKGRAQHQQGFFLVQTTCAACKGIGAIIEDPCTTCSGTRTTTTPAKVTVHVPPAVEHGQTLRLTAEGSKRADGTAGDLDVYLLVGGRPDPRAAAFEQAVSPTLPEARVRTPAPRVSWQLLALIGVALLIVLMLASR